ncbi:hypothetical protein [Halogeometricum luteum]|uniref:C2H2-type domain-containing protein n=1 Tax=Halogeometricum luteum TaxID=2950537 RepID=A0ABU2G776_9EURY|nr:hypothetical protein [Halogeometricum sp. S3BR5-2]MDS0296624.1 hypothetical protein [Halogeometricum sp. S3BR5-2]
MDTEAEHRCRRRGSRVLVHCYWFAKELRMLNQNDFKDALSSSVYRSPIEMSQIQTTVPEGETPAGTCEYCGHPFPTTDRLVLHRGREHSQRLDDIDKEKFKSAFTEEEDALRSLRLRALAILVILYFGLLNVYAVFA